MADLYLARRDGAAGFRRLVAIKVIHPRHAQDEQVIRMFLDEARISARIDHPNVVHVEDLGQLDETYFLVMEYVHGCSLAQLLSSLGEKRRRLSPVVAVAVAARVAEGLHAAHETTDDEGRLVGLVHRDVSPQNILLSHKGHVKLIDFGVAKARLRSEETNVAMLKGKVRYMPPEQATTGLVDRRSDVYSLGIVLWEMLTMRRLFTGKTEFEVLLKVRDPKVPPPSTYVQDVPPALDEVVLAALAPRPDDRPPNAKVFRRMLASALPEAMTLDSAHLADLLLSVAGAELAETRHTLPEEISRVLQAEQLRVAGLEQEEREVSGAGASRAEKSIVEAMTVHSDLVQFEVDELDRTPDVGTPFGMRDSHTAPGSPVALARSGAVSAQAGDPSEEEEDPTEVGTPPTHVPSVDEDAPTPRILDVAPTELPVVPAAALAMGHPQAALETYPIPRRRPSLARVAPYAVALVVSVLVGVAIALALPGLRGGEEVEAPPAVQRAATPAPITPVVATAAPETLSNTMPSVGTPVSESSPTDVPHEAALVDAGAPDAGPQRPARRIRARRRRIRRQR